MTNPNDPNRNPKDFGEGKIEDAKNLGKDKVNDLRGTKDVKDANVDPSKDVRVERTTTERTTGTTPARTRVLLVEDEQEVASLVQEMLRSIGCEVVHAMSARAALGALANGRHIDLVFSDVMMPGGMNGVELAREIRVRALGVPVLLTSGYAEAAQQSAAAEGVHVLAKPYRLEDLAASLHDAIEGAKDV